jgi:beta-glucosidase/6-phospho-beta-glucosidase/beta-galactosidase
MRRAPHPKALASRTSAPGSARLFAPARPASLGAVAALAFACSASEDAPREVDFPEGFLFGSATAAYQIEKGIDGSDWSAWTAAGKAKNKERPDVGGPDALAHIDEDVEALASTKQNAYRFSIEWSRIYPTRARFDANEPDETAIATYRELLTKLRARGITPMVTLQHFTLPLYLSDPAEPQNPQGWERPETVELFGTFCARMGERFGDLTDWWTTVNEPLVAPLGGYFDGSFPPGLLASERILDAVKGQALGHVACYDALHRSDRVDADGDGKPVLASIAHHMRTFTPKDPSYDEDVKAAERVRFVANHWFLEAVLRGNWDDDADGSFDGPKDRRADPALAGRADYLGVNYYSDTIVTVEGLRLPFINAFIQRDKLDTGRPRTELAWDIYPEGFGKVIDEAARYGLPIVITENGLADASDTNRPRYLAEHLWEVGRAIDRGVDIRGYFHWSLVDNFEWAEGFCPKFGLFRYDAQTGARSKRPSADLYRAIIEEKKLTRATMDGLPAYRTSSDSCH